MDNAKWYQNNLISSAQSAGAVEYINNISADR